MNKVKVLSILSIGLLAVNIALVTFFLWKKPGFHRDGQMGPRNIIIEKLHFDDDQIKAYDVIIQEHQKSMFQNQEDLLKLKKNLYTQLNTTISDVVKDSIINEIAVKQKDIEYINYAHFENIKKICKKDQLADFEKLSNELANLFSPNKRKPPHPRD
ncbi:MAG: hypothetical protein WCP57_11425 [Bacteroidota bacterium]